MNSKLCSRAPCIIKVGSSQDAVIETPTFIETDELGTKDIQNLFNTFQRGIVAENRSFDVDPLTSLVRDFGSDQVYRALAAVNTYVYRDEVRELITAQDYPLLFERIQEEILLTPIEIAEFIRVSGYTPTSFILATGVVSDKIPRELEAFYTKSFSQSTLGGFCALLPKIFGTVGLFFSALETAQDLINRLKNFSLSSALKGLVDRFKEGLKKVFEKAIQRVKDTIENFSMQGILDTANEYINQTILGPFYQIKAKVTAFFSEENIERIKKRIQALIDYAVSIFKNPSLEDIQYLLYRFCGFVTRVEDGIGMLKKPIEDYVNSYKQTRDTLRASSSRNTVRAVSAGAIRLSPEARDRQYPAVRDSYVAQGNIEPIITDEERANITQWNNGEGDSRITFPRNARWKTLRRSDGTLYLGRLGWDPDADGNGGVNDDVKGLLMRVQKDFGRQLIITSGYRSPEYNEYLRSIGVGAAKNSLHMLSLAVDVTWSGFNEETADTFIRISRFHGFRGTGKYISDRFVHIDVGPNRSWEG
jgi:hypothetical protein